MSKELKEMLNEIDHYCLDNDKHFYDFRSLYEAINKPLTPEQKTKIFNTAKDIKDGKINDPDVLDDVIDAVRIENDPTLKQQVNKKLNEEDKGEYEVFVYGQNRNVKKPITYFDTEAEAEDFCNDHDWTYIDPDSRFEWNMDYRIAPKKVSDKEIYGFDLNEKLVEAPQEVIDDLISILNEYGFILDDSVGHENPSKSLLFGDTHIQVINPDSYIDTLSDDINVQEELQKYIPRDLINKIHELDQTSNCPITWNFGINKDGNVTGGLDVMKQYVPDDKEESLKEASYGGAYDIEDDMFFTKEELIEFAGDLAEQYCAWANHEKVYIENLYIAPGNWLTIELYDGDEGIYIPASVRIDMRKIRLPRDIYKYSDVILKQWKDSYNEYHSYDESLKEDLIISPEKEYQSKSGHRILIKDVTPYMSEYDGTANLRIKYDYKLAGSDEWGSSECNQYDLFKMLNEDYERNDDEWGDPYSFGEVERELKKLTNNWSDQDGTIRCYYEQEKQYGVQILKKHYDIVETSDGRTGSGEEMSWVIAYARPKMEESFNESMSSTFNDRVKLLPEDKLSKIIEVQKTMNSTDWEDDPDSNYYEQKYKDEIDKYNIRRYGFTW